MRLSSLTGLAVVSVLLSAQPAQAQRGYYNRVTVAPRAIGSERAAVRTQAERNELSSYRAGTMGYSANGRYARAAVIRPPVEAPRPSAAQRSRNYFPGLTAGHGANRNYISPSRLCVPGRRAFIY